MVQSAPDRYIVQRPGKPGSAEPIHVDTDILVELRPACVARTNIAGTTSWMPVDSAIELRELPTHQRYELYRAGDVLCMRWAPQWADAPAIDCSGVTDPDPESLRARLATRAAASLVEQGWTQLAPINDNALAELLDGVEL